ncbi:hypothetical protein UAY_00501 [Enterococcus moraviensis ATCC BAA-383]|uniref:Uncharacterized protein n=1 Tax=Enterococcus moraviensis ATCC BAA-383 TaxID=1158609 RepID=R2TXG7_9ENTE|nr:hypothetical protein UAY_00501 [Enterococcus moraviensis ATCC BAA-383]EOT63810.1 hypothetical protein I586_03243 [Enterococcus moraviensis ATCC BAA-383]
MNIKFVKAIGYLIISASILLSLLFSFNPDKILVDGNPLDTGYMISKTLFIITSLLISTIIGVQLINKK